MKKISTTAIAKQLGLSAKEAFGRLVEEALVEKVGDKWQLTDKGFELGGEYRESKQYGQYIVWPETWVFPEKEGEEPETVQATNEEEKVFITATDIGKFFELSANKINFILSELGWLKKGDLKGWVLTEQGRDMGGIQTEAQRTGIPFVRWHDSITDSDALVETVAQMKGKASEKKQTQEESEDDFRGKFEAKHRTTDGHMVRSKAEMLIDNWLYMAEIVHAYERKLPIEENVYSDFYIPTGKVYIEYWGFENNPRYLDRKKKKIKLYEKYGFNLIQLEDKEVQNLDDILPKMLLKYGVQAY
jgi:Mn-dependent DtxR family transcriptional regulator